MGPTSMRARVIPGRLRNTAVSKGAKMTGMSMMKMRISRIIN